MYVLWDYRLEYWGGLTTSGRKACHSSDGTPPPPCMCMGSIVSGLNYVDGDDVNDEDDNDSDVMVMKMKMKMMRMRMRIIIMMIIKKL